MLIEPTQFKDHFEQHFAPRNTVTQPEIENPELFPHVLPPNNIQTNEEIPDEERLKNVLKKKKMENAEEQMKFTLKILGIQRPRTSLLHCFLSY